MNHEDQGEFRQAEDAFVKAGKPREAIDMYIHQQDFEAAMRVAEHYDAAGIPIVCTAQGRIAFGAGNYKEAEALLLRGNAAELLVKLYRDAKMLTDARRVAREHAPEKAAEIAREEALTSADPMAAALSLEDNKEFQLAIEQYLRVNREHTQDQNRLVAAWRSAVRLASQHSRLNLRDTVKVAVQHMVDEGRFSDAAITLEETDDFKGAISLYCRAEMFDKAEALAQRISPDLVDFVKRERIKSAFAKNEEQSATDGAKKDRQLDAFVQNNEWEKAMKVARQKGPDQARAYASLYCQALLKEGNIERALEVIARDGMESDDIRFFKVFTQLAFAAAAKLPNPKLEVQPLHDGLYRIVQTMTQTGQDAAEVAHAQAALSILHCYAAHESQVKHGLTEQAYQSMLALPRYVPHIAADKAYFDAGIAAREAGQAAMGFVFLNHFLDITDMIQDGERTSENLEPRDFALSDYPQKFPLPKACTVPEEAADEARQWVLTKSLDPSFKSGLPTVVDPATGATMFVATLRAPGSAEPYDACAVTGMPILNVAQRVRCTACTRPAELDAWNRYLSVAKCCPWCKAPQNIVLK
jgi:intraflagellar transport protein 172